jgi:hypothetical protein
VRPIVGLAGVTAIEASVFPLPLRATVCGLPEALSVMVNVPLRVPFAVGVKRMVTTQFAAAASVAPQVLVWAKSPVIEILLIVRVAVPEFVTVTVCALLVVPTTSVPKLTVVTDRFTAGAATAVVVKEASAPNVS